MESVISRDEARAIGFKHYFTAEPCRSNHLSKRFVSNGQCVECHRIAQADQRRKRREREAPIRAERERLRKQRARELAPLRKEAKREYKRRWKKENAARVKAVNDAWIARNKERHEANTKRWRAENPDKVRGYTKAWAERNPEKERERHRARYRKDPQANYARNKEWHAKNPEARRVYNHNYVSKKRANGGKLSKGIAEKLFKLQKGKCACCGKKLGDSYHLDHIIPIALGGPNSDDNVQLLRQRCNNQKRDMHPVDFMQERRGLLL